MKILLGIINVSEGGCFHGTEGIEGMNVDATKIEIIKKGTEEEIRDFVKKGREDIEKSKKINIDLDDYVNFNISDIEYSEKLDEYYSLRFLTKFNQLIMVDGEIL